MWVSYNKNDDKSCDPSITHNSVFAFGVRHFAIYNILLSHLALTFIKPEQYIKHINIEAGNEISMWEKSAVWKQHYLVNIIFV